MYFFILILFFRIHFFPTVTTPLIDWIIHAGGFSWVITNFVVFKRSIQSRRCYQFWRSKFELNQINTNLCGWEREKCIYLGIFKRILIGWLCIHFKAKYMCDIWGFDMWKCVMFFQTICGCTAIIERQCRICVMDDLIRDHMWIWQYALWTVKNKLPYTEERDTNLFVLRMVRSRMKIPDHHHVDFLYLFWFESVINCQLV